MATRKKKKTASRNTQGVEITLDELRGLRAILVRILNTELDSYPAYWFGKLMMEIGREWNLLEEVRVRIIKKYARKTDEDGKKIPSGKEKVLPGTDEYAKFYKEYAEFLTGNTVTISIYERFPVSRLADIKFSPSEMIVLDKFLKNDLGEKNADTN